MTTEPQLNTIEDVRAWVEARAGTQEADLYVLLELLPEPQPEPLHFETLDDVREWAERMTSEQAGLDTVTSTMNELHDALKPRRMASDVILEHIQSWKIPGMDPSSEVLRASWLADQLRDEGFLK